MAKTVVMKYGGKSLAHLDLFRAVALYIQSRLKEDPDLRIVAVVSAMGNRTDQILGNLRSLNPSTPQREQAAALQVGEAESAPYLAAALDVYGIRAQSYNAFQLGIQTVGGYSTARISSIDRGKLDRAIEHNHVITVAGYQGVSENADDELSVLGRGGSDASAVALAAMLGSHVEFYKADVAGVHAFDPRVSRNARVLPHLTYEEALMLTEYGYEFLMSRSLEIARRFGVKLEFRQTPGLPHHDPWHVSTAIDSGINGYIEDAERSLCAIAVKQDQAMIVISDVPNIPGWSDQIFERIDRPFIDSYQGGAGSRAVVCIIARNSDREYLMEKLADLPEATTSLKGDLANITLIDRAANEQSKIFARVERCLHRARVNIEGQYSSRIFIHTLVNERDKDAAVLALAREFNLEEDQSATSHADEKQGEK